MCFSTQERWGIGWTEQVSKACINSCCKKQNLGFDEQKIYLYEKPDHEGGCEAGMGGGSYLVSYNNLPRLWRIPPGLTGCHCDLEQEQKTAVKLDSEMAPPKPTELGQANPSGLRLAKNTEGLPGAFLPTEVLGLRSALELGHWPRRTPRSLL